MEIDIISYTDEQYAELSEEQILEVRSAQLKKNRLTRSFTENLQKEKAKFLENGTYFSEVWDLTQAKLQAEYDEEVGWIREALLFYLRFSARPEEGVSAPYKLDYSLTVDERVGGVQEYYMTAYTDPTERFEAYKADEVARAYLGERYKNLYDYLLWLTKQ